MALATFTDIAARNDSDAVVGLIDEASRVHPELAHILVRPIKGYSYKTRVRTANPTAAFRAAGAGIAATRGTYENRTVETFILNPRWEADKAVADANEDGPEVYIFEEATGLVNAAFAHAAAQMYYGNDETTGNDTAGFPGLIASVTAGMTLDAGGTTAATGSSVWGLATGVKGVNFVLGAEGKLDVTDVRVETITGSNDESLTGYVQELLCNVGLQVGNLNGVGRIRDLTADAGKGLTDDLLADFLALFPIGNKPDMLLMSRRSRAQLQKSRTATTESGRAAATPVDFEGIPIYASDSLSDTEALSA